MHRIRFRTGRSQVLARDRIYRRRRYATILQTAGRRPRIARLSTESANRQKLLARFGISSWSKTVSSRSGAGKRFRKLFLFLKLCSLLIPNFFVFGFQRSEASQNRRLRFGGIQRMEAGERILLYGSMRKTDVSASGMFTERTGSLGLAKARCVFDGRHIMRIIQRRIFLERSGKETRFHGRGI